MCGTCGCEGKEHNHFVNEAHTHEHNHHEHTENEIVMKQDLLSFNDKLAAWNRGFFAAKNILAINVLSGDGAGKTTLLVSLLSQIQGKTDVFVIEGDLQTELDADKIRQTGAKATQINTGTACHLDAHGIHHVIEDADLKDNSLLFIENVGNLVCPAAFDLGEGIRIVLLSVAEGDEKPLKYPHIFASADVLVISKTDMAELADFDTDKAIEYAKRVNPNLVCFKVSAKTGEGVKELASWILNQQHTKEK